MRGGGDIVTFDDLETKLNEKGAMEPFLKLLQCGSTFEYFKQDVWDVYKVKKVKENDENEENEENDVEYEEDKINIKKIIDDYFSDISALDKNAKNLLELKRLAFNEISESDELLLEQTLQELQKS
jgi:hypothetical protein